MRIQKLQFDLLKAILTNCIRHGPKLQNRAWHPNFRAFLQGKIAHVASINPAKGKRLKDLFEKISWNDAAAS